MRARKTRGQGLVEFGLLLPGMLLVLLSIAEAALLFQTYLAIQHAAREAARFAVTYQPPKGYTLDQVQDLLRGTRLDPVYPDENEDEWDDRRVGLIKTQALEQLQGLRSVPPAFCVGTITDIICFGLQRSRAWGNSRCGGRPPVEASREYESRGPRLVVPADHLPR